MSIRLPRKVGPPWGATAINEIWMESRQVDVKAPISLPVEWLLFFNLKQKGWKIGEMMVISGS